MLIRVFEQSLTKKQDQLIYDSSIYGGPAGLLPLFKNKKIGEVSSILNIMYRPGMAFEQIDLKSKTPRTIGESIIRNYTKKQVDALLSEVGKKGEFNSLSLELKIANNNRKNIENIDKRTPFSAATKNLSTNRKQEILENVDKAIENGRKKKKKNEVLVFGILMTL